MRPSYMSTLDEIEKRTLTREKVAARAAPAAPFSASASTAVELRDLASTMRKLGEQAPAPGYEDLYAVLDGTFALPELPTPPSDEGRGAPLRKLAHELRTLDLMAARGMAKSAEDAGHAALGLTLLCERLGSLT